MLTGHTVITSEISLGAILSCIYICVGESKKFLEEAMKNGYVVVKLVKVIVVGPAGVGKTSLIYLLLGKDPPDKRHSTGCAERSIRVIRIGKEGEGWSEISTKEFIRMIAEAVPILYKELKRKGKSMDELAEVLSALRQGEKGNRPGESGDTEKDRDGEEGKKEESLPGVGEMGSNDSEPTQAAHGNVVVDRVIQDLTRSVGGLDISRRLLDMDLIYLTDCGGQQAYCDIFPIFMRGASATLFVYRLCEKLDEHPLNDLYQSGEQRARLTTAQAFKTMLQGLCDEGKRSKIIAVGTHKDLASECEESLSQKNKRLEEIASPHFSSDTVYRNESLDEVIFQVNTRKPDGDDKIEASKIRASIKKGATEVEIPIWWFILQQILETLASQLGREVLSVDECIHVSNTLGFSEAELDAALSFFDKLNVFVYKKDIIPNVVFTNAQVPLDKLWELVEKQYQLKAAEQRC